MSEFSKAFRAARNAGDKTFEWNGKKYTTELAKADKAPDVPTRRGRLQSDDESSSVDKIPTGGSKAPASDSSNEESSTGRNVGNTLAALGGLGAAGALAYKGVKAYKGIKAAADLASKAKKTEEVVAGNASNASRMKDIAANAEKAVAKKAADKDAYSTATSKRLERGNATVEKDSTGFYSKGGMVRGNGAAVRGLKKARMF